MSSGGQRSEGGGTTTDRGLKPEGGSQKPEVPWSVVRRRPSKSGWSSRNIARDLGLLMPFPVAHPAVVSPLRRYCPRYLNFPALVVGSLSSDFGYVFGYGHVGWFSHRFWAGSIGFCLPAGLLVVWVFYLVRCPAVQLLPARYRELFRPPNLGPGLFGFRPSGFFRPSDFGFRIWPWLALPVSSSAPGPMTCWIPFPTRMAGWWNVYRSFDSGFSALARPGCRGATCFTQGSLSSAPSGLPIVTCAGWDKVQAPRLCIGRRRGGAAHCCSVWRRSPLPRLAAARHSFSTSFPWGSSRSQ